MTEKEAAQILDYLKNDIRKIKIYDKLQRIQKCEALSRAALKLYQSWEDTPKELQLKLELQSMHEISKLQERINHEKTRND